MLAAITVRGIVAETTGSTGCRLRGESITRTGVPFSASRNSSLDSEDAFADGCNGPGTRMFLIFARPLAPGEVTMVGRLALIAAVLTMLTGCQAPRQHASMPPITDRKRVTQ